VSDGGGGGVGGGGRVDGAGGEVGGGPSGARTFEELMAELEGITARMAAGDLGIEAAADLYEQAERLHTQARERLEQVRARVERMAPPGGEDRPQV
jgi:exodeoxyribonuclease VII small subunit